MPGRGGKGGKKNGAPTKADGEGAESSNVQAPAERSAEKATGAKKNAKK